MSTLNPLKNILCSRQKKCRFCFWLFCFIWFCLYFSSFTR